MPLPPAPMASVLGGTEVAERWPGFFRGAAVPRAAKTAARPAVQQNRSTEAAGFPYWQQSPPAHPTANAPSFCLTGWLALVAAPSHQPRWPRPPMRPSRTAPPCPTPNGGARAAIRHHDAIHTHRPPSPGLCEQPDAAVASRERGLATAWSSSAAGSGPSAAHRIAVRIKRRRPNWNQQLDFWARDVARQGGGNPFARLLDKASSRPIRSFEAFPKASFKGGGSRALRLGPGVWLESSMPKGTLEVVMQPQPRTTR